MFSPRHLPFYVLLCFLIPNTRRSIPPKNLGFFNTKTIFKVKNNGIPIPKEDVTKIYEYRFTTTEKGSGIGLYFSKYIVQDKLGGSITLEQDKEGYTTIFSIKIPLYHEEDNINN